MLYRDNTNGIIWTELELVEALRAEISDLADDQQLKREYDIHGDLAIREYIIEASLVGLYDNVEGQEILFRTVCDSAVFTADEVENRYVQDVRKLGSVHGPKMAFGRWACGAGLVDIGARR
ncbi:hypothetical protein [Mycolicibacterium sp. A43C]